MSRSILLALAVGNLAAAADLMPTYDLVSTKKFDEAFGADIAGSSFVDSDGQYRFISSVADYSPTDNGGSFTKTWSNDDFGKTVHGYTDNTTTVTTYNAYWNKPGTFCYQLDKREKNPMPSLYQDDHCDIVGVWIDPVDKAWVGIVNDEYQFDPWTANATQNDRIHTGRHNNRVMLARSTSQGENWELVDQICTDQYQPEQTIDEAHFPNKTYSWGLSGTRFFADYATGYAYGLFNHQVRFKKGDATIVKWFTLARAPLENGLAPDTWRKYTNGRFDQPGIGGTDGVVGEPLGLNVIYDPKTDYLAYEGTGKDGSTVKYQMVAFAANSSFTFSDDKGTGYTVDTGAKTISGPSGKVDNVVYMDPALGRTITVGPNAAGDITVNTTDPYGVETSTIVKKTNTVFRDPTTNRLYVMPDTMNESGFTYNVPSGKYQSTGYNNIVYQTSDLGQPNSFVPVGRQPEVVLSHAAYVSVLDTGSLTRQDISSHSYSILSDLYVSMDNIAVKAPTSDQTAHTVDKVPKSACGKEVDPSKKYRVSVGGNKLPLSDRWTFEPLQDPNTKSDNGFYRVKGSDGTYLQVSGSTPSEKRKWGASVSVGSAEAEYNAEANGGFGSPGGSDQWYFHPIGANTPKVIDAGSEGSDATAAHDTSLDKAVGYKLVNRNSGNALTFDQGQWVIAPNVWKDNEKQVVKLGN